MPFPLHPLLTRGPVPSLVPVALAGKRAATVLPPLQTVLFTQGNIKDPLFTPALVHLREGTKGFELRNLRNAARVEPVGAADVACRDLESTVTPLALGTLVPAGSRVPSSGNTHRGRCLG